MKTKTSVFKLVTAVTLCLVLPGTVLSDIVRREMNVRQGPETVFDQPVSQIIPDLNGAQETRQNGRVGGELVFWGYKLANGSPAYFYACAAVEGVDCLARREKICTQSTKVLSENQSMGQVQRLTCRVLCVGAAGTENQCCTGGQENSDLQVGLVSCGG